MPYMFSGAINTYVFCTAETHQFIGDFSFGPQRRSMRDENIHGAHCLKRKRQRGESTVNYVASALRAQDKKKKSVWLKFQFFIPTHSGFNMHWNEKLDWFCYLD